MSLFSSKHLCHSIRAFILSSVMYAATNTAAQHIVQMEKYLVMIPFQTLSQMRTETSDKIIEVRGRFPKVARTLVILADAVWYIQSPPSPEVQFEAQMVFTETFPGNFSQDHSGTSEPQISGLIWWSEIIQATLEWLPHSALWNSSNSRSGKLYFRL